MTPKLLVVDDDPIVQRVIQRFFERNGYEVLAASNGATALDLLRHASPTVMLLDIRMPQLDGIEVLRTALEIDPRLPVIVVTGLLDPEMAKRIMEAGARDFVTKPIDFDYLATTVMPHLV